MPPEVLAEHSAAPPTFVSWADVLDEWPLVEADLHEAFGIDMDGIPEGRTWRWLRTRILALISGDTRTGRAIDRRIKRSRRS